MNSTLKNKEVSFGGHIVITDWRKVKIATPENLQDKVKVNENVDSKTVKTNDTKSATTTSLVSNLPPRE